MVYCITAERRKVTTLEKVCFDTIAKNFDVFITCISRTDISFLQQKSQMLLETFMNMDGDYVVLEHALFCMNSYLKELCLSWINPNDIPTVIEKLETVEITFTTLHTSSISLGDQWRLIRILPYTLKSLRLTDPCTDSMLEIVAKRCPNLQTLELEACEEVSDSGVKALCCIDEKGNICQNRSINYITFWEMPKVTREGVGFALENFPNLLKIEHDDLSRIIGEIFLNFSNDRLSKTSIPNLKSLNFADCSLHTLKMSTMLCPNVTKLDITLENQAEVNMCADFITLEEVNFYVWETFKTCDLLPFLKARGESLKKLEVYNDSTQSLSLEALVKFCPRLERLYLEKPKFDKLEYFADSALQHNALYLTDLYIYDADHENLEESLIFLVSRSPNLETFILKNFKFFRCTSFTDTFPNYDCMSSLTNLHIHGIKNDVMKFNEALNCFGFDSSCSYVQPKKN